ncbi:MULTISPECIES: alpha/beta hydrolase [Pontibacillus]|uniref:Alpha/beta hydrolase n=1 Tax=Pontibacillus chungwhensis TaxID=265426 RepID=A0ABY8UXQ6_9BACI|nr:MULTISPECIES: alpha/beta hydrolase [Pontibacillus]MCD5325287.1 alpha/beta hydrolase [Pontibacillus sp. HN14]WIF97531.1 alpha/beta hydrolase [Pontibacillus chungwhensis]
MKKWKWWQKLLALLGVLVIAVGIAGYVYLQPYEPTQVAIEAMKGTNEIDVEQKGDWISFLPTEAEDTSILFYPGGLVEPESYAPLAHKLAENGYPTYILKMPLNLAVLAQDKADELIEEKGNRSYVIGGHSLGGAMAARYAAEHEDLLEGIFLLGAYPDEGGDLSGTDLSFLSITGENDGVMNREKYKEGKNYVPEDHTYIDLGGANHGQFGSYGFQEGDQKATISGEKQRDQTVELISNWLAN